ncbi:hypothetical protein KDA_56070 [Dictyobacter alpinus]|uniref:Uncharacterized protein n=1 Tax=Dictyobacter alpinus TaxID=2014873 RepID=A0A402BFF4_9CHLR|nr:hypothetical protein [Dictyobacter alpinus]GCE30123.1 hypothetical protein KDA_56070 [Dictyobacter alpinus]
MPKQSLAIDYYVRDIEQLYDNDLIQRCLQAIAERGYHMVADSERSATFDTWYDIVSQLERTRNDASVPVDPDPIFTPGSTAALEDEIRSYCTNRDDYLPIRVYSTARSGASLGFDFLLSLAPEDGLLNASIEDIYFTRITDNPQENVQAYEHWLEILQILYTVWHPIYAHLTGEEGPYIDQEEARALDIQWLYDINFLSPELVDRFGRERVLATPAWRIQTLDDNGVLIVPKLYYGSDDAHSREAAASHLGLPTEFSEE